LKRDAVEVPVGTEVVGNNEMSSGTVDLENNVVPVCRRQVADPIEGGAKVSVDVPSPKPDGGGEIARADKEQREKHRQVIRD
jgi:hypothetical protein